MISKKIALTVLVLISRLAYGSSFPISPDSIHPADQNPLRAACGHTPEQLRCVTFLYNYDGDTLTVRVPDVHPLLGEKISVRIVGIDAPEMHSSNLCERNIAVLAQKFVFKILSQAQRIDLVSVQRDKYFRILADVRVDDQSLSQILLSYGFAYVYNGGTKRQINWCERMNEESVR